MKSNITTKRISENINNERYGRWSVDGHKISDDFQELIVGIDFLEEKIEELCQLFVDTQVDWPEWFSEFVTEYDIDVENRY